MNKKEKGQKHCYLTFLSKISFFEMQILKKSLKYIEKNIDDCYNIFNT